MPSNMRLRLIQRLCAIQDRLSMVLRKNFLVQEAIPVRRRKQPSSLLIVSELSSRRKIPVTVSITKMPMIPKKALTLKQQKVVADFIDCDSDPWNLPTKNRGNGKLWRPTHVMDRVDIYWQPKCCEPGQREDLIQKTAQLIMQQRASDYFLHDFVVLEYFEALSAERIDYDWLERICFYLLTERKK